MSLDTQQYIKPNYLEKSVKSSEIDTDVFIKNVLDRFGSVDKSTVPMTGGKSSKSVNGTRKLKTYSEISFGGTVSEFSDMARQIKNQSTEIHERVIEKIMKLMNVSADVARNYKAVIYRMVKEKHPELNNYDRAVEMEKLANIDILSSIDIKKVTEEISAYLSEKQAKMGKEKSDVSVTICC